MARFAVAVLSVVMISIPLAYAQSDPQALTFASQAMSALTGGTAIADVTLTGSVTRTVGSDVETGTATMYVKGQSESRIDLNLGNGNRSEVRNSVSDPQGEWIGPDNQGNPFAQHNCFTDPAWFFPALSSLASANDPRETMSYLGLETLNGASVQHLHSVLSGQQLSAMDFYLDAGTLLPIEIDFNGHPDNDSNTNIPTRVVFSNYQNVNGALVPYHIQDFFNGSLLSDFTASGAVVNSGLADSLFAIQ